MIKLLGARLGRINWLGDLSEKSITESAGIMVNYLYVLEEVATNHDMFVANNIVRTSQNLFLQQKSKL